MKGHLSNPQIIVIIISLAVLAATLVLLSKDIHDVTNSPLVSRIDSLADESINETPASVFTAALASTLSPSSTVSLVPTPLATATLGIRLAISNPITPTLTIMPTPQLKGKIVFTCQIFQDVRRNQICLVNADGSDWRRMTTDDFSDHTFASIAPDGESIVFSSDQTGSNEIYEMDLNGNQTQLTFGMDDANAPEISPDGKLIVFARTVEGQRSIWLMERSGEEAHQIFGPPDGNAWDPTWSPDGAQILFASDRIGLTQLFIIDKTGANLRQVTSLEGLRGRNDWSPDGNTLATYIGVPWYREIVLMNLDGSNLRYITNGGNNLAPSFSPDGNWITFTSYRDRYMDQDGCEIYVMKLDGSEIHRLTDNDYCDWQPRWGP